MSVAGSVTLQKESPEKANSGADDRLDRPRGEVVKKVFERGIEFGWEFYFLCHGPSGSLADADQSSESTIQYTPVGYVSVRL